MALHPPVPLPPPSPSDLLLRAASDYFAGVISLNDVLQLIMDRVIEVTRATKGFVILKPAEGPLEFRVARNIKREEIENPRNLISQNAILQALETGAVMHTPDAGSDPRFSGAESVHNLALKTILCVPLTHHGKAIGVIYLENRITAGAFSTADSEMVAGVADLASSVLAMARTMESTRHERDRLADENELLRELFRAEYDFGRFIGRSPIMKKIEKDLARLARNPHPVLIQGESGTGKEMVARILHASSDRAKGPFVAINCAAVPATLFESELFGYVRGAFTGAEKTRIGRVESAEGGTLFLDEVGDLPAEIQPKLLRLLQEQSYERLGENEVRKANVRVLAASNKDLAVLVEKNLYREDLYFRLSVLRVRLPALHERREDIPDLAYYFLRKEGRKIVGFSRGAIEFMKNYSWPGNVRALRNVVVRAAVYTSDGESITEEALLEQIDEREERMLSRERTISIDVPFDLRYDVAMQTVEREYLRRMLQRFAGLSRTELADKLGMKRRTLFDHLAKLGLTGGEEVSSEES